MEFKPVKTKLNLIYTGSLLMILIIFIIVLYLFISGAIKKQEIEQLNRFYEEGKHEFIEEIYEHNYEREEEKDEERDKHEKKREEEEEITNMNMWNINRRGICSTMYLITAVNLIKGEETVSGFAQYLYRKGLRSHSEKFMKEVEWKKAHVLIIGYPLQEDHETVRKRYYRDGYYP